MKKTTTAVLLLSATTFTLQAETILINARKSAAEEKDSKGNYWNTLQKSGVKNLVTIENQPTGISCNWSTGGGGADAFDNEYDTHQASDGSPVKTMLLQGDGVDTGGYLTSGSGGQAATITFKGLVPEQEYTFYIYGSRGAPDNRYTKYVVTGGGASTSAVLQTTGNGLGNDGKKCNTDNVATLIQTASSSGQIIITYSGNLQDDFKGAGTYGYINVIQVQSKGSAQDAP